MNPKTLEFNGLTPVDVASSVSGKSVVTLAVWVMADAATTVIIREKGTGRTLHKFFCSAQGGGVLPWVPVGSSCDPVWEKTTAGNGVEVVQTNAAANVIANIIWGYR
ncbi:hypothetical protein KIH39_00030 [Telmatocola sphagniphila]|uniref:Uncharacterized protein n=1 Tax=Telmatocola sphagniphila TaxID=1123043 RepID=A0A8E6B6M9_9BACT|nr:hypothetical protein [Telmatocola sphagniphila]QVL32342.1 hypothetical protein KIH39_00030 [Telmatocola sphagniphila]